MLVFVLCFGMVFAAGAVTAQTMVEAAVLAGAGASGAGAKGKSIGSSIGTVFGKVNGTLAVAAAGSSGSSTGNPSTRSSSAQSGKPAAAVPAQPAAPEPTPPKPSRSDFDGVEKGMPRGDLFAKVGKPLFSVSMTEDGRLEETLRYATREGASARVLVTNGKVASIEWSEPK